MNISNAQHVKDHKSIKNVSIKCTIDGTVMTVPLDPANRHYAEILKQVKAGTLTIKDAD
tara:strand:- start:98 stop:274 length:177 start_codon:yes stop_codon:yes gene_type:complete